MKKNEEKTMLAKHSALIQTSSRITAVQKKGFNALLFFAKKQLEKEKKYEFNISANIILKIIGLGQKHHSYLKNFLSKLQHINVRYNILNKDKKQVWGAFALLAGFEYKEGIITYSFPHQILNNLIDPKTYAYIDLKIIKGLQSKYAIVLYELARDYLGAEIPEMTVEKFKELMGVSVKYKEISSLREYVIKKALREINSNKNINFRVDFFLKKTGKKYTSIKFLVKEKKVIKAITAVRKPAISDRSGSDVPELQLRVEIRAGFENLKGLKALVLKSLRENGREYTERNISYANKNAKSNYAAFLKKSIAEDWSAGADAATADTAEIKKKEHEKILKKFLRMQVQGLQSLASAGNIYAQEALQIKEKK